MVSSSPWPMSRKILSRSPLRIGGIPFSIVSSLFLRDRRFGADQLFGAQFAPHILRDLVGDQLEILLDLGRRAHAWDYRGDRGVMQRELQRGGLERHLVALAHPLDL